MNQKSKKTQKLIFPEHVSEIISELMEKYEISEDTQEVFARLKRGDKTKARKIANLIREVSQEKISEKNLPSRIQEELNIPKVKATSLARDIRERILTFLEKVSPEPVSSAEKKEVKKELKEDIYREPIK